MIELSMRKFLLSIFILGVFTVYTLRLKSGDNRNPIVTAKTLTPLPTVSIPTSVPSFSNTSLGKYKDGTYTGSVADAFYGNIQVQAVISGGKITDVIFLQSPNDRGRSIEINSQAMPLLKQEAIQAQLSQVDGVSGATASSGAFVQSLGDALNQASI